MNGLPNKDSFMLNCFRITKVMHPAFLGLSEVKLTNQCNIDRECKVNGRCKYSTDDAEEFGCVSE